MPARRKLSPAPGTLRTVPTDAAFVVTCPRCEQVVGIADSCVDFPTLIVGDPPEPRQYNRLRFGHETAFAVAGFMPPQRCHDCGVTRGGYHHTDCCVAECPRCHRQLMSCPCIYEDDEDWDPAWMRLTN